jgi:S-adenosylmethionine:tRNA-ribosyltransferase-isomerase (queuine synthetase)
MDVIVLTLFLLSFRIWEEDDKSDGNGTECFVRIKSDASVEDYLSEAGSVPIPPYLHRSSEETDKESYNNIYAANSGSVAAPTAGECYIRCAQIVRTSQMNSSPLLQSMY